MRAGAGYVTACVPASLQPILAGGGHPGDDDAGAARRATVRSRRTAWTAVLEASRARRRAGARARSGSQRGCRAPSRARWPARAEVALVLDADGLNAHAGRLGELTAQRPRRPCSPRTPASSRACWSWTAPRSSASACATFARPPSVRGGRRAEGRRHADRRARRRVAVSPGGSPALATAGTGRRAHGRDRGAAGAGSGCLLGGRRGRLAARRRPAAWRRAASGAPEGVIATDVIAALPAARRRPGSGGRVRAMADSARVHLERRRRMRRAQARVNLAAIERNCARLRTRAARRGARCARSSRLTATATGPYRAPARRSRAARAGWRWPSAHEARELREAGCGDVRVLVMGALSTVELQQALAAGRGRGRLERAPPARRSPPRAADGCTSSSTPAWAGSARATRPRPSRVARGRATTPGVRAGRR